MHISLILFPNAPDFIRALVIDTETEKRCWRRDFHSIDNATNSLLKAGIASAEDAVELHTRLMLEDRCPVFHAFIEESDLTSIGFQRLPMHGLN